MLGTLAVVREGARVDRFRTRRVGLLLAFLAYARGRHVSRDEVGELLWPEQEQETMRRNLRQALSSLRHVMEPPPVPAGSILTANQTRLQIDPDRTETDVAQFDELIGLARFAEPPARQYDLLKQAIDLYKGDFLPGYDDDWVLDERLRLADLYVYCLRRLIDLAESAGRWHEAIHYLHLGVTKDRFDEEWRRSLMRLYIKTGRPAQAIQQFMELRKLLRNEFASEPSDDTRRLARDAQKALATGISTADMEAVADPEIPAFDIFEEPSQPKQQIRLPIHLSRFYGRQSEIQSVVDQFQDGRTRLATLLGPAGAGKTRMSVEVGRRLADMHGWNVWFVPLADLLDASRLHESILAAMDLKGESLADPVERIAEKLAPGNCLIVLDNMEHIIDEAIPLVSQLAQGVPELRLLVTSRQALKLEGEREILVDPLPWPENPFGELEAADLSALAETPSVQLFVDRCQAVRPDFQLTTNNAVAIASICASLEGIPLAIEIAAGLSNSFTPAQMVNHLQKRITALTSRRRDIPARHRSVRAAIDYSYHSLPASLQRFFAALSVFRGGFTVEAANQICFGWLSNAAPDTTDPCLAAILDLLERSLVRSEEGLEGADLRFRMLEAFREFGEEQLTSEELRELKTRHVQYFLGIADKPADQTISPIGWHIRVLSEFDNGLAAIEFAIQQRQLENAIKLLAVLATSWLARGPMAVERAYIRRIVADPESESLPPAIRILLLRMMGTTFIRSSEYAAALRACEQALAIAERAKDNVLIATCYSGMAVCTGYLGDAEGCIALNKTVLDYAPQDNLALRERTYLGIGAASWNLGELEEAKKALKIAKDISIELRGGEPDVLILYNLARTALDQGQFDEAMTLLGDALRISQRLHDDFTQAILLSLMARYHQRLNNPSTAIAISREGLYKARTADFSFFSLHLVRTHALILLDLGQLEAATTLFAATLAHDRMNRRNDDLEAAIARKNIEDNLPKQKFDRAWAAGLAMDIDSALRMAVKFG